jgi:predicted nucleic acid-binding protein
VLPAVSDSGPLIHLAQAGHISQLKIIFGKILIIPAVKHEVVDEGIRGNYSDVKLVADALVEGYVIVHKVTSQISKRATRLAKQEKLSQSDSETLMLAHTLRRPLLTDERVLSALAKMYGLEVWNTWTVLLEALRRELIEKQEIDKAISDLGERRHKLSEKSMREILDAAERIAQPKSA